MRHDSLSHCFGQSIGFFCEEFCPSLRGHQRRGCEMCKKIMFSPKNIPGNIPILTWAKIYFTNQRSSSNHCVQSITREKNRHAIKSQPDSNSLRTKRASIFLVNLYWVTTLSEYIQQISSLLFCLTLALFHPRTINNRTFSTLHQSPLQPSMVLNRNIFTVSISA